MKLERLVKSDLEKIRNLQPEGWADIIPEFEFYISRNFCFPVKVTTGRKIVGTGSAIALGSTGWLAHIIVDPEHRNKGIGFQITNELIRILRMKKVITFLLISTDSGRPVYCKAGFKDVTEYIFLKRTKQWPEHDLSVNVIPCKEKFYDEILNMDLAITGERRELLFGEKLNHSWLYVEDDTLLGYYVPGIGEGPIVAILPEAGLNLMKIKYSKTDKAILPSDNTSGIEFLKSNGFEITSTRGTRMIMGKEIYWEPEKIYSRIGGNLG